MRCFKWLIFISRLEVEERTRYYLSALYLYKLLCKLLANYNHNSMISQTRNVIHKNDCSRMNIKYNKKKIYIRTNNLRVSNSQTSGARYCDIVRLRALIQPICTIVKCKS